MHAHFCPSVSGALGQCKGHFLFTDMFALGCIL